MDMNVAETLARWPEVIPVFIRHRMACVGCNLSAFETLGDAARTYGLQPEAFLEEVHRTIRPVA
ncbi:MAG: DUF1858 domain-containing protein [Chloroflexi bacterium]|nr:DUF1858 domain-containing protein [Chloroflexota bacterium]